MRGCADNDDVDVVAARVVEQRLRDVARFEHVQRELVLFGVDALRPVPQQFEITRVHGRFTFRRLGAIGLRRRNDGDTGEPRAGTRAQRALRCGAQRKVSGVGRILERHCDHDDGHFFNLRGRERTGLVGHANRLDPALEMLAPGSAFRAASALGDANLFGVGKLTRQMRGRRIASRCFRRKAAQNHFLQPRWQVGPIPTWRRWIHPQTLAQSARSLRVAERQFTGRELIEHHAHSKNIAARIAANTDHLLWCHPRWRANRLAQFLRQQVGIVPVIAQSKIEQHR